MHTQPATRLQTTKHTRLAVQRAWRLLSTYTAAARTMVSNTPASTMQLGISTQQHRVLKILLQLCLLSC